MTNLGAGTTVVDPTSMTEAGAICSLAQDDAGAPEFEMKSPVGFNVTGPS